MAIGTLPLYAPRVARRPDSTATITIVQRAQIHQGSSAVSSDAVTSAEYVITLGRIEELKSEAAEEDRIAYVAMTRLDLSGGLAT